MIVITEQAIRLHLNHKEQKHFSHIVPSNITHVMTKLYGKRWKNNQLKNREGDNPHHIVSRWKSRLNCDTEYLKHWIGVRIGNLQGTRRGSLGLSFGSSYISLNVVVGSCRMIIHARCLRAVRIEPGSDPYTRIHHFHVFRHLGSSGNRLILLLL